MEIPKYHETFLPVLEVLNKEEFLTSRQLTHRVRDTYYSTLPKDLLDKKTSTGANVLLDRISWAKSYLKMANLVSYPRRGMVQITAKGKQALKAGTLTIQDLQSDEDFIKHKESVDNKKDDKPAIETELVNTSSASPQDLIDSGFAIIETEVKAELLDKLKGIDPYYFEKVILKLLKKMGYV